MGNSTSCCQNKSSRRGDVLVIKEDGESLRFKDGILVKDVLSVYPHHKIIRCCSERTVLIGDTQLSCNSLYFLLPVGLALSEAAYQSLVRSAVSRNLVANGEAVIRMSENVGREYVYGNECSYSYKWKPDLRTIPEIATPSS